MEARDWVLLAMFFVLIFQVYVILSLQSDVQQLSLDLLILGTDMYDTLEIVTQAILE